MASLTPSLSVAQPPAVLPGTAGGKPGTAANTDALTAAMNLNSALTANQNAYGGEQNALQQQYQQNAGNVQQNLVNSGLGNTTVAQNMQQAPLQTYNNAMLNLIGQQQGQAANIYGQGSQQAQQAGLQAAALQNALQVANVQSPEAKEQAQLAGIAAQEQRMGF